MDECESVVSYLMVGGGTGVEVNGWGLGWYVWVDEWQPYLIMGGGDGWSGVGVGWMRVSRWYLTSWWVMELGNYWRLGG